MNIIGFLSIVTLGSGMLVFYLGFMIAVKQKTGWINGVDFSSLTDVSAFTRAVGNSLLTMGGLFALIAVLLYMEVIGLTLYSIAIFVVCLLPLPSFYRAKQKYS